MPNLLLTPKSKGCKHAKEIAVRYRSACMLAGTWFYQSGHLYWLLKDHTVDGWHNGQPPTTVCKSSGQVWTIVVDTRWRGAEHLSSVFELLVAPPGCSKPAVEEVTDFSLPAVSSKAAREAPFCKGDPSLLFGDTVTRTSPGEAVGSEPPSGGDSGLVLALVEGGVSSWPAFPPSSAATRSRLAEGLCSLLLSRLVMRSATLDPNLASPPRGTSSSLSAVALYPSNN